MGKKSPSPQSERPTSSPRLPRAETELGSTFHLDHPLPNTTEHGIIHIEVESKTWIDNYEGTHGPHLIQEIAAA
jgi:hypothetical protein